MSNAQQSFFASYPVADVVQVFPNGAVAAAVGYVNSAPDFVVVQPSGRFAFVAA